MKHVAIAAAWALLFLCKPGLSDDWPHWRGPNRNGIVSESSGFSAGRWLSERPNWTQNVGQGSTSPLVVADRLYTMGWADGQEHVVCLDARIGRELWKQSYRGPQYGRHATGDQGLYRGPSSTPEYDAPTGYLYTLGSDGELHCWDTAVSGKRVWRINLYDTFDAPRRPKVGRSGLRDYGYTSSPLIVGDQLIVEVGGSAGNLIGFDKRTGRKLWASESKSPAGHNGGPVPLVVERVPCVAVHNFDGLLVVRLDAGKQGQTVATYPWETEFANNIASVAVEGNRVILTSAYNHFKMACFEISLQSARRIWQQDLASKVCTPIIHDGHVYWAWQSVHCLDFATGQPKWKGGRVGDQGSCVLTADERLIVWTNRGDLLLVDSAKRSPSTYREVASKKNIFKRDAWPHVTLAGRRLYCKDRDGNLACFDLSP
jgi:outer membrane protein assembly factor BamB